MYLVRLHSFIILSRVRGSVANNNGFWNRWLDLLELILQLQSVIRAHNQWLRLAPFLTGLRVSSLQLWRMPNEEFLANKFCWAKKWKLYYDRRSVGQSVLEQSTHLGLTTRSWLLSDSCMFVGLGGPLWREDGSAVVNYCWSLPAQSFSGPSPLGLAAIFCCLRFETCLFVASYDSQGHGGGIRSRLHKGICWAFLTELLSLKLSSVRLQLAVLRVDECLKKENILCLLQVPSAASSCVALFGL
jgi:hypothetical protein